MSGPAANNHFWFNPNEGNAQKENVAGSVPYNSIQHQWNSSIPGQSQNQNWYNYPPGSMTQGSMTTNNSWNWNVDSPYQQRIPQEHNMYQQSRVQQYTHFSNPSTVQDPWNWGIEDSSVAGNSEHSSQNSNNNPVDPSWDWSVDGSYETHSSNTATRFATGIQDQNYGSYPSQSPRSLHGNNSGHIQNSSDVAYNSIGATESTFSNNQILLRNNQNAYHTKNLVCDKSDVHVGVSLNAEQIKSGNVNYDTAAKNESSSLHSSVRDSNISLQGEAGSQFIAGPGARHPSIEFINRNVGKHSSSEIKVEPLAPSTDGTDRVNSMEVPTINAYFTEGSTTNLNTAFSNEEQKKNMQEIDVQAHKANCEETQRVDATYTFSANRSCNESSEWSTESLLSQGTSEYSKSIDGFRQSDIHLPEFMSNKVNPESLSNSFHYNASADELNFADKKDGKLAEECSNSLPSNSNFNSSTPLLAEDMTLINKDLKQGHDLTVEENTYPESLSLQRSASNEHVTADITNTMGSLSLVNSGCVQNEFENREIAPPESEVKLNEGETNPVILGSTSAPPPMLPKTTSGSTTMGNPYAGTKAHLNHKYANKYLNSNCNTDTVTDKKSPHPPPDPNFDQECSGSASYNTKSTEGSQVTFTSRNVNTFITSEDGANLETVPDNKERPDVDFQQPLHKDLKSVSPKPPSISRIHAAPVGQDSQQSNQWKKQPPFNLNAENQEVAPRCGPDRNQYLETGQLIENVVSTVEIHSYTQERNLDRSSEHCVPPPGLHRMVPGQINEQDNFVNSFPPQSMSTEDSSTPPPGLHRMIPGQFTERENSVLREQSDSAVENARDDVLLQRIVPGHMTEDERSGPFISSDDGERIPTSNIGEDVLPPGLRRMVPGESSSPESQGNSNDLAQTSVAGVNFQPITSVPMEPRVVMGVAEDEIDISITTILQHDSSPSGQMSGSHSNTENNVPSTEHAPSSTSLQQPPSERSETIGSDSVEIYPQSSVLEQTPRDIRRDAIDRERRHRDEQETEERENMAHRRRQTNGRDYYNSRDSDESPGSYRDEWDRRPLDRDRSRDPDSSPGSGRLHEDERERRHYETRRDCNRRRYDDERRPRHRRRYNRNDGADDDYYSDREERDRHERSTYREDYDGRYRGRNERERAPVDASDKGTRDRPDHRSSVRERDKDRRRNDYHHDRHDYRRQDYYGRMYEDEQYYRENQRSRPNSRSGSRPEFDDYHRQRDYQGYGGYGYYGRQTVDPYHYDPYYSYKYYENLRRTNPAAYAEWYAKYYSGQQTYQQSSFSEDRASVHSGRSSANEEYSRDRPVDQSDALTLEDTVAASPQRLTPAKFSTAHVKAKFCSSGRLLKILPHYPLDGQAAVVEIHDVNGLVNTSEARKEFEEFPGPLIKGITHKNSLISFCTRKIKKAERDPDLFDRESVILLWRLLILLLRQNGIVVGTDISELLLSKNSNQEATSTTSVVSNSSMKHSAPSPALSHSSVNDLQSDEPVYQRKSEEEITNQFREYLLYGNTKEALEWAMKQGLWGHALFLASKMDQRTYANVMMRFANGLTMNDPLQTLYQLMSGRQPAVVTCCADEKWGDWRPHLAMILSNATPRPDLDRKAITTLGDTLGARGCLHAAHFCYLMAQMDFGTYSQKSSKFVLLGSSHFKQFCEFATNEAIQMTEIYIYACQLADPEFDLPHFQDYKFLYAQRLAEYGMPSEAIHYVEVIASTVCQNPGSYSLNLLKQLYDFGDRLKYYDPVCSSGNNETALLEDPEWLVLLKSAINEYSPAVHQADGPSYGSVSNLSYSETDHNQTISTEPHLSGEQLQQESWQYQQVPNYYAEQQNQWIQQPSHADNLAEDTTTTTTAATISTAEPNQSNYWSISPQWNSSQGLDSFIQESPGTVVLAHQMSTDSDETSGNTESQQDSSHGYDTLSSNRKVPAHSSESDSKFQETKSTTDKQLSPKKDSPKGAGGSSWFGGIWNKLALRPKNQMKLPDDKNPSIVWDPDKKRWTNLDGNGDEVTGDVPPPPKISEVAGSGITNTSAVPLSNNETAPPQGANKYKMNKGRSLRSNYVDVFGGSKIKAPTVPAPELFPSTTASQTVTNYFVPAPVESDSSATDFLTPTSGASEDQQISQDGPQLSRWSSTSSLSREVQQYTMKGRAQPLFQNGISVESQNIPQMNYGAPLMYNPTNFTQQSNSGSKSTASLNRKRYVN